MKPGAPAVWDEAPNNVSFALMMGNKDATDAAFAGAKHVVSLKVSNTRITANSIEPRAAIGQYHPDSDSYTLYSTSQNPHGTRSVRRRPGAENSRDQAARDLARRRRRLRHEARRLSRGCAGGVGVAPRRRPAGQMGVDALGGAARRLARPRPGRHRRARARRARQDSWACASTRCTPWARTCSAPRWWCRCSRCGSRPASIRSRRCIAVGKAVLTNTIPLAPYRGAGRPEATYLIEQLLDRAARVIGIDPVEIRRRNFIPAAAMPHKIGTGVTYDSGDFMHVMDECLKLADWNGFAKRAAESKKNGKLRGRGIGYFLEEAAVFNDRMVLRFDPSGMLTILAGTHSHGQGHDTVYAQMVTEWLGVPFENIRFVQGDTDAVPIGRGTYGSRSMHVGGNALKRAADAIIEKAKPMAAMMLEAAAGDIEFKDGAFSIVGTDRALPLTDVAKAFYRPAMLPPQFDVGPRSLRHVRRRAAELSERLPRLRGRDRSGDRRGHARRATPRSTTSARS